jgi:hypothetical protein
VTLTGFAIHPHPIALRAIDLPPPGGGGGKQQWWRYIN